MTPEELKKSIFQLACSGNLTNCSEDGAAYKYCRNVLKIPTSEIIQNVSDYSFNLPDRWVLVKFKNLCEMSMGQTVLKNEMDESGDPIYSATIEDTPLGYIDHSRNKIKLTKGDLVIPARGNSIGYVTRIYDNCASGTQTTICVKLNDKRLNEYLYVFFMAYKETLFAFHGAAIPQITINKISEILIPIPSLEEQEKIVSKIKELLPLIERYEKVWSKIEDLNSHFPFDLKKSIIQLAMKGKLTKQCSDDGTGQELLEEIILIKKKLLSEKKISKDKKTTPVKNDEVPFDIPKNWVWTKLQCVLDKLVDGDHNPPQGVNYETDYWMLSSTNIGDGVIENLDKKRFLTKEIFEIEDERTRAEKGDIFFTSVGTLGRSCIYNGEGNYCFQRSVSVMHTLILNKFLKYYFDSPYFQMMVVREATGTAQKGFYLQQLADSFVPIPPLNEQKRIVAKLEELLPLCEKLIQ